MEGQPHVEAFNTQPKVEIQSHLEGVEEPKLVYEAICSFGQDLGGGCHYNVLIYGFGATEKEAREKLRYAAMDLRESIVSAVDSKTV